VSGPDTIPAALARFDAGSVTLLGQPGHPGGEVTLDAGALRAGARRVAGGLHAAGARAGDRVLLVLPTGAALLEAFLGCNLVGAVPCLVSPPEGFGSGKVFDRRLASVQAVVDAWGALAPADLRERVAPGLAPRPVHARDDLPAGDPPDAAVGPDDLAFLQLTSGTTRLPRAVRIPQRAVAANARQIAADTAMGPGSRIVSWLPLFHDMGLMALLSALFCDLPLVLSSPLGFLVEPASWLRTIARFGATHSPAPTFAYRHLVARTTPAELAGVDLSSWEAAFVGAERIHADVLRAFEERAGPLGLPETALLPCYGMAEATLAIAHKPRGEPWRARAVGRRRLSGEGVAAPPEGPDDALELVSCGRPLPPTTVRVLDDDGAELPPDRRGEIAVRGPSLFAGYHGVEAPAFAGGELRTGDLGFLDPAGELFVIGRRADTIILRGENHRPEEVEWAAGQVPGVRPGRVAAFGVPDPAVGTERLCLVAELDRRAGAGPAEVEVAVRRRVHEENGLALADVRWVRRVPVTTSGKIQRARARALYLEAGAE